MCGIVGFMSFEGRAPSIERACDSLVHRGPDDGSIWINATGSVAFGHRRLSIVDLSPAGRGPFVKDDLTITYNGEVYGFRQLRRELESMGHSFRSETDTEVVLEAYRAFGPSFVERIDGMFALAIWDERKQVLLLARDRVGIKPLYVYRDDRCIAFASELKALERIDGLLLEPDETAAYDFLTYLYVPAPKSIYSRVQKLRPAHCQTIGRDRRSTETRYWSVDFTAATGPTGEDAALAVREAIDAACASQLVADVPVGCLLSGGVDSSTVAAFSAPHHSEPLRTFSIGFDVEAHSETRFARAMAEHLGSNHTERIVGQTLAGATFEELGALYDEPFGDLSAIPTLEVCRLARESVTVALSGDGGDEVFGGYTSYSRHLRREKWFGWVPLVARRGGALPAAWRTLIGAARGGKTLIDGLRDPLERHAVIQGGFVREDKRTLLSPKTFRHFEGYDDLWAFRMHDRPDADPMTRFQIIDLATYLPDDILTKVDRASMACSLELRPPLLDHRLIELVASIPGETRNPAGELKSLFKRAVASKVPWAILDREKKGFSIPVKDWFGPAQFGSDLAGPSVATLGAWVRKHGGPSWAESLS